MPIPSVSELLKLNQHELDELLIEDSSLKSKANLRQLVRVLLREVTSLKKDKQVYLDMANEHHAELSRIQESLNRIMKP